MQSIFDERIQRNGAILVQRFNIGIMDANRWRKTVKTVSKELNELFWGVAPFRLKKTIIVGSPIWMKVVLRAQKIEERTITVTTSDALHNLLKNGAFDLPVGFIGGSREFKPRYKCKGPQNPQLKEILEDER